MIKSKELKYKLAVWKFIDRIFTELSKNPDIIQQKLVDSIVRMIIGDETETERENTYE